MSITEERILKAATELFAVGGFDGVSIDEIARAAEVSRATVFNRFRSKRGLVEALTSRVLGRYAELLKNVLDDRETSFGRQILLTRQKA